MTPTSLPCHAEDLDLAAASRVPVLITAATRSERERCARRIHEDEGRGGLFGVVHGADAGSLVRALVRTRGGTLFLDDIGQMSPEAQQHLLVATASPELGVRIIAGTPCSLLPDVAAGAFSETLFYRLNVIHVAAPPPREAEPVAITAGSVT